MARTTGSALGVLLWISSFTSSEASIVAKRALVTPSDLPGTWTSQGCWVDIGRTLTGGGYTNDTGMTDESCIAYCEKSGYIYAGTEYSQECYCGNTLASGAAAAASTDCSDACTGNSSEACGGSNRLNLFWSGTTGPQTNLGVGLWKFSGCYNEGTSGRALTTGMTVTGGSSNMTVSNCLSACQAASYDLAGVEYSGQCYCGNAISNGGTLASSLEGCNMLCNGNFSEYCGGSGTLDLYDFNDTISLPAWNTTSGAATVTSAASTVPSTAPISTTSVSSSSSVVSTTSSAPSTSSVSESTSVPSSIVPTTSGTSSSSSVITSSSTSTSATAASTQTDPANEASVGPYIYYGCYTEATNARALASASYAYDTMTLESCEVNCAGYTYWGTEYGHECYCGNSFSAGSVVAAATDCSFPCAGNSLELCGAGNRLSVYVLNGTITSTTTTGSISPTSTTSTGSVSITTNPAATGFPTGWVTQGCWVDGVDGRILSYQQPDQAENTLQLCVTTCANLDYTIAGAEYGVECFCDNYIYNGGALAANQGDCDMECPGDTAEDCGAGNRLSIYAIGTPKVYAPPAPQTSGLPANWAYSGCLQDNIASNEDPDEILSTFPYMAYQNETFNDATQCITLCQQYGYNAAGLEYGSQCFCGDVENILVASAPSASTDPDDTQYYTRSAVPQIVADSECNVACPGNTEYYCGAGNLLSYYSWNGSTPLYEWGFPSGNDAGSYSLLIGGVVVPLIVSQGVNGKVSFLEKHGTGEANGTGAYELDLTLVDNFELAWRTMTGLQSDVFCAAGLTLPDKAGRQLTVGGWAGESNFGIRLYWPDGSAGVNGTNEWVESPTSLQLQVARWYPSGMIMANGSILVVGGEIGQNDPEQPTLELLPATGVPDNSSSGYSNTTVYLDFLARTWPFNLYPFICVVPSGIFIAYYNEARILDEVTFETIKELPNMPGAVNDPTGGRTYQLEGSMVLLPQYAPYDEALSVLICGGSTSGGGYAIDNCISTQPEADEPVWTIERMPSRRVMPCMAGLPDGTYVILNGGQHGVAAFGLGGSPNYNAVIYDPSKPVNQRMSIMANTSVARLYHSEATVLLDGRVLVSGSDPSGQYPTPAGTFPEEYRIEVFTPPYLLSGLAQPTFTLASTDWAYGETVSFTVTSGTASKVTLLGSVVSTHGNAMGQRTLVPAFSCDGDACTVTAPPDAHTSPPGWFMMFVLDGPTPSVGQFVRIGGDPAGLGNWPDLPGFDLPGV